MASAENDLIGDYKVELDFIPGRACVRKALGPWPMRNWSWITFYNGTVEECREFAKWAQRIDARDQELIGHAASWLAVRCGAPAETPPNASFYEHAVHLPKTWGYDFTKAMALYPKKAEPDHSGVLIAILIVAPLLAIFGFIYHSTRGFAP